MNATNRDVIEMNFAFTLKLCPTSACIYIKIIPSVCKKQRFVFLRFTCHIKLWMAASAWVTFMSLLTFRSSSS